MSIYKCCLGLIIFLFVSGSVDSQNKGNANLKKDSLLNSITNINKRLRDASSKDTSTGFSAPLKIDTAYANELHEASFLPKRDERGLLIPENNWMPFDDNVTFRDTVIQDPVFLPVIFDGRILPEQMDFMPKKADAEDEFHLIPRESTFAPQLDRMQQIQNVRRYYFMNNPQRIFMSTSDFVDPEVLKEASIVEKKNIFKELLTTDDAVSIYTPEVEKIQIKPVYWIKTGEHSLQVNQNSFSHNWSSGGNNNFSVLNYHKITLNYKKNKVSFNNTIEWRLNMQQNSADTLRNINITDDYLRTYSVLGISAFIKKWSYTANLELKTPLFDGYPINSKRKVRAILSPLNVNTGIGMSYTLEKTSKADKYKKTTLSLSLSPLSVNYTFVGHKGDGKDGRKGVDVTKFGIDSDKRSRLDFGSTINANLAVNFNRFSGFTSRLKYFSNYEKVLIESENKFTMAFNRFLSSSVYYYLRFDDGVGYANKSKGWGYFQYNEVLGFGLSYTW